MRLLVKLQRKVESAAGAGDWGAFCAAAVEATAAFSAAAAQARTLRAAAASPAAAQLLQQHAEDAGLQVDVARDALYGALLRALQQRLAEVRRHAARR